MEEPRFAIPFLTGRGIAALPDDELAEFARNGAALCDQLRRQEETATDAGGRSDYAYAEHLACRVAVQARRTIERRSIEATYAAEEAADEARRLGELARTSQRAAQVRAFQWWRDRRIAAAAGGAS